MCGRYSNRFTWKELHELYRAFLHPDAPASTWTPKFNVAPTTEVPVIRFVSGARRIDMMRWGLVPSWSREIGKFATFNARSDGVREKPAYRGAWKAQRRCIIPASSFFEWRKADKQPFAIALGNGGPMGFAGLWDAWKGTDGGIVLSFTIITTDNNEAMSPIHDRMPVILDEEDWSCWLGEEPATDEQLQEMLRPCESKRTTTWQVESAVGNVKNQGEHLLNPRIDGSN